VTVALVAALFVALCVGVELLARSARALSAELVRKLAHMGSAVAAGFLPLVLTFGEIALLGVAFAGLMAVSLRAGLFTSIHGVARETYGEILFPLGIAALALACPSPLPFAYGVLVLGLGDGLAALVGESFGRRAIPLVQTRKTLWGTGAFIGVCFGLGVVVLGVTGVSPAYAMAAAAAMAVVLTPIELFLAHGFDNLALPVVAGLLLTGL
jgi:phytol kinase